MHSNSGTAWSFLNTRNRVRMCLNASDEGMLGIIPLLVVRHC